MKTIRINRKYLLLTGIVLLLLYGNCWNIKPVLPEEPDFESLKLPAFTQTGENVFGCLIDGKVFTNNGLTNQYISSGSFNYSSGIWEISFYGNVSATYFSMNSIIRTRSVNRYLNIIFEDTKNITEGSYTNFKMYFNDNGKSYELANDLKNELKIVKIETNGIVAGTFEGLLVNKADKNDFLKLTEGRFDFKH